jgi:hypothetical protein
MPEEKIITAGNKLEPFEDFTFLRSEGIKLIEKLSGKVWTDYNGHDPGITLLEALCYALTDLGYRTAFDIKDILASDSSTGAENDSPEFSPREILPSNPVTINDYRKLVIDTDGIKNAWLTTSDDYYEVPVYLSVPEEAQAGAYELTYDAEGNDPLRLKGLYKVTVQYDDGINTSEKRDKVAARIRQKLNAHRNLCEDFLSIRPVEFELFRMTAEVVVFDTADIEKINAQIFLAINNFFSPAIKFYTVDEMMAKGYSPDEIFEGPLLKNGFIDTADLEAAEKYTDIHLSDIIHLVSDIEGVIAVKKCVFPMEAQSAFSDFSEWMTDAKDRGKVPELDIENSVITFVRSSDRHRSTADKSPEFNRVKAIYTFLQSNQRNTKLKDMPDNANITAGRDMDIAEYFPFQHLLPACYHMQQRMAYDYEELLSKAKLGLKPQDSSNVKFGQQMGMLQDLSQRLFGRPVTDLGTDEQLLQLKNNFRSHLLNALDSEKRKTLQLRGYLMVFEQIMANHLSQLSKVKNLFSLNADINSTYFSQALADIADQELLTVDNEPDEQSQIRLYESENAFIKRRDSFLNHLLARFGENMDQYGAEYKNAQKAGNQTNLKNKASFLNNYIALSNYRSKGFNYHNVSEVWNTGNVSGARKRICALLGIRDATTRFSTNNNIWIEKITHEHRAERYAVMVKGVNSGNTLLKSNEYDSFSEARETMNFILTHGYDAAKYKIDARENKFKYALKSYNREDAVEFIAEQQFDTRESLDNSFKELTDTLAAFSLNENFHLLEHLLLRPKIDPQGKDSTGTVNLLSVPQISGINAAAGKNDMAANYKFDIKTIHDPKINEKMVWALSLNRGGAEVIHIDESFIFKNHVNKRIEHIRQVATDKANYNVEQNADGYYFFKLKDKDKILGSSKKNFPDKEEIDKLIDSLVKFFSYELQSTVEESPDMAGADTSFADPYSFQVSVLIPSWPLRFKDPGFKHRFEKALYMEIPAHIYAQVYWLDYKQMSDFENTFKVWLQNTANNEIPETSVVNNLIYILNEIKNAG